MRIISFPHAPMQAFWSAPVQILAPWINRIRHSFSNSAVSSGTQHLSQEAHATFVTRTATAVNDDIFDLSAQKTQQSSHVTLHPHRPARSALRVVRESDAAIRPDCAGRMVISGRMADVCAELERMAQQATGGTAEA